MNANGRAHGGVVDQAHVAGSRRGAPQKRFERCVNAGCLRKVRLRKPVIQALQPVAAGATNADDAITSLEQRVGEAASSDTR